MNHSLASRISNLERTEGKGIRVFTRCDDGKFLPWGDGSTPDPMSTGLFDRAHIEALKREGWQIIVVEYQSKWRSDATVT